jgi:hypothetical protein
MFVNRRSPPSAKWNELNIEIRSTLVPKVLWQTASIDVFLEGKCILQTGGQLKLIGSHSVPFDHAGETHEVKLSWGRGGLRSFPFDLYIDGQSVASGRVFTSNWYLSFLPWAFLAGFAIYSSLNT